MTVKSTAAVWLLTIALVMTTLAANASLQNRTGTSAGVVCAYFSDPRFHTIVLTAESDGSQTPPVTGGISCAAAFNALFERGFELINEHRIVGGDYNNDGSVDAADYVVWRKTLDTPPSRPGTTVVTACAHFSGAEIRTELVGVDHAGRQHPPFITGMSCAAAFNLLMDHGFTLVHKGPTLVSDLNGDGIADSQDYDSWRSNFGQTTSK